MEFMRLNQAMEHLYEMLLAKSVGNTKTIWSWLWDVPVVQKVPETMTILPAAKE